MFEDDEIKGLLKFVPWWAELSPSAEQQGGAGESSLFLIITTLLLFLLSSKSLHLIIFHIPNGAPFIDYY